MLRELQVPLSPELTYAHERQMNNVGVHGAVIIGPIFHSQRHLIRLESVGLGRPTQLFEYPTSMNAPGGTSDRHLTYCRVSGK
jgi:hypothetical protein